MGTNTSTPTVVTAYGKPNCSTCEHYRSLLDSAGVSYDWFDISNGPIAVAGVGEVDGPTIVFSAEGDEPIALRRPSDDQLQRAIERYGFAERTIHLELDDDGTGRYVLPLAGGDAFITFVDNPVDDTEHANVNDAGDGAVVRHITYSEVPVDRRGQGLGAELSRKTLDALIAEGLVATFGCGYVGAIADRYQPWRDFVERQR